MMFHNSAAADPDAEATILPEWFSPSDKDVICGWARQNHRHAGNQRFRQIIDQSAPLYVAARTKLEKTQVIASIVEFVRSQSPGGGFVKRDFHTGRWFEIGDDKARDKVGHAIRRAVDEMDKKKVKTDEVDVTLTEIRQLESGEITGTAASAASPAKRSLEDEDKKLPPGQPSEESDADQLISANSILKLSNPQQKNRQLPEQSNEKRQKLSGVHPKNPLLRSGSPAAFTISERQHVSPRTSNDSILRPAALSPQLPPSLGALPHNPTELVQARALLFGDRALPPNTAGNVARAPLQGDTAAKTASKDPSTGSIPKFSTLNQLQALVRQRNLRASSHPPKSMFEASFPGPALDQKPKPVSHKGATSNIAAQIPNQGASINSTAQGSTNQGREILMPFSVAATSSAGSISTEVGSLDNQSILFQLQLEEQLRRKQQQLQDAILLKRQNEILDARARIMRDQHLANAAFETGLGSGTNYSSLGFSGLLPSVLAGASNLSSVLGSRGIRPHDLVGSGLGSRGAVESGINEASMRFNSIDVGLNSSVLSGLGAGLGAYSNIRALSLQENLNNINTSQSSTGPINVTSLAASRGMDFVSGSSLQNSALLDLMQPRRSEQQFGLGNDQLLHGLTREELESALRNRFGMVRDVSAANACNNIDPPTQNESTNQTAQSIQDIQLALLRAQWQRQNNWDSNNSNR